MPSNWMSGGAHLTLMFWVPYSSAWTFRGGSGTVYIVKWVAYLHLIPIMSNITLICTLHQSLSVVFVYTSVTVPCKKTKNKDDSDAYFDCIAVFEAPYCWTSNKGGAHSHFTDSLVLWCMWALSLTKFSNMALWTWQCDQHMQQNNLQFLHGISTCIFSTSPLFLLTGGHYFPYWQEVVDSVSYISKMMFPISYLVPCLQSHAFTNKDKDQSGWRM